MKKEDFFDVLGELDDDLVKGAKSAMKENKKRKSAWVKWGAVAACLCLVVAVGIIGLAQGIDSPNEYAAHIFSSYEEFASVVPDIQIIENLSKLDGVDVTIYGALIDASIEDHTKIENYAWFDIGAKQGEKTIAAVRFKLNDKDSAAVYIKNYSLVNEKAINGEQLFYAYNADLEYWDSIVEVDGNYYNILYYSASEQDFIDFISVLLKK